MALDLEKIRQSLVQKREELIKAIEDNTKESKTEKAGVEDTADEVTAELSRETMYKLSQAEKETLFLIDLALKKIEAGTYGFCEECGEPIGGKRLEAIPWVRLCIECSQQEEAMRLSNGYEEINYYNIIPDASSFIMEEDENRNIPE